MFSQGPVLEYVALPARSGSDSPATGKPAGRDALDRPTRLDYNLVMALTGAPVESFFLLEPGSLHNAHRQQIEQARRWLKLDLRNLLAQAIADGSVANCATGNSPPSSSAADKTGSATGTAPMMRCRTSRLPPTLPPTLPT